MSYITTCCLQVFIAQLTKILLAGCAGGSVMHLPHLSPTGLVGRTSSVDSMDDDSSGSAMGYGNPYLASGMSKEIGNSLTQDPDAAYRYVGKLNAQQQDRSSWKMDKLCDAKSNDSTGLGHWLEGEEVQETDVGDASEEEEKLTAEDEDRFSTEDAKYSEGFDSSTEGTLRESGDEDGTPKKSALLPEANYLSPAWLDTKRSAHNDLTPRRKLLWDGGQDRELGQSVGWSSGSNRETEPSLTESEESGAELRAKPTDTTSGSPRACPVLCFDEYGNLTTTYQEPSGAEGLGSPTAPHTPEKQEPSPNVEHPTNSPSPKALRSRTKMSQETNEHVTPVSEQELQQAFKEEYNTAATSRYGRARKRKTVDGFFFGTINFNELRKITSGSPKKVNKGGGSKNSSPDQKAKVKEEGHSSLPAGPETKNLKDLNENGIGILDSHPINGEAETPALPLETVQMDQAKDSTATVQNKEPRAKKLAGRRRSTSALATPATHTTAIVGRDLGNLNVEEEEMVNSKPTTTAKISDSFDSGIAGKSQQASAPRRVRRQKRQRVRATVGSTQVVPRSTRLSRLLAAQASQANLAPSTHQEADQQPLIRDEDNKEESMAVESKPSMEEPMSTTEEPKENSQLNTSIYPDGTHSDSQEKIMVPAGSPDCRTSDAKAPEVRTLFL